MVIGQKKNKSKKAAKQEQTQSKPHSIKRTDIQDKTEQENTPKQIVFRSTNKRRIAETVAK